MPGGMCPDSKGEGEFAMEALGGPCQLASLSALCLSSVFWLEAPGTDLAEQSSGL